MDGSENPLAQCMLLVEIAQPDKSGDCEGYDVFRKKYRPRLAHRWALGPGVEGFEVDKFAEMAFPTGVPIRPSWRAPSYMAFALTLGAGERLHAHCLYHWALAPKRALSLFRMQLTIPLYSAGEEDPTLLDDVLHLPIYTPQCLCIVTSHPHHLTFKAVLHRFARELPRREGVVPGAAAVSALWQELTSPLTRPLETLPPVLRVRNTLFRFPRHTPHTWTRTGRGVGGPRARSRKARRCARCGEPEASATTEVAVPRARALRAVAAGLVRPGALREEEGGGADTVWVRTETPCPLGMPSADVNYRLLAERLSPATLVACLGALLTEQQVVAVSARTWVLHECLEALVTLLWPVGWPHTFIPVLPSEWMDILSAPIPYLIGTNSAALPPPERLDTRPLVLDLDRGELRGELVAPFPARLALRLFHASATAQPLYALCRPGATLDPVQLGEEAEEHALRVAKELADRASSAAAAAVAASAGGAVASTPPARFSGTTASPGSRARGGAGGDGQTKRHSIRSAAAPPPPSPAPPYWSTVPTHADPVDFRVVRLSASSPAGSSVDDGLSEAYEAWREAQARRATDRGAQQQRQQQEHDQPHDPVRGDAGEEGKPAQLKDEEEEEEEEEGGAAATSASTPLAVHRGSASAATRGCTNDAHGHSRSDADAAGSGSGSGQSSFLSAAGGLRSALWRSGAAVRRSSLLLRRSLLPASSEAEGGTELEEEEASPVEAPTAASPRDSEVTDAAHGSPWQDRRLQRQRHRQRRHRQRRRRRRRRRRKLQKRAASDDHTPGAQRPVSAPAAVSSFPSDAERGGHGGSWLRTTAPQLTLRTLSLLESSDDEDDDEDGELWLRVADHQRALRAARVGAALAIGPSSPGAAVPDPYRAAGHRRGVGTLRPAAQLEGSSSGPTGSRPGMVVDAAGRRQAEADLCDALLRRALRGRGLARLAGSADRETLLLRLVQGMGRMVAPRRVWGAGGAESAAAAGEPTPAAPALSKSRTRWRSKMGLVSDPEGQGREGPAAGAPSPAGGSGGGGGGGGSAAQGPRSPLVHSSSITEAGDQVEHAGGAVSALATGHGSRSAGSSSGSAFDGSASTSTSSSGTSSGSCSDSDGTRRSDRGRGSASVGGTTAGSAAVFEVRDEGAHALGERGAEGSAASSAHPASSDSSSSFSSLLSSSLSSSEEDEEDVGGAGTSGRRGHSHCAPGSPSHRGTGLQPTLRPLMRELRRWRRHRRWPFGRRGGVMAAAPAVKSLARELAGRDVEDLRDTSDEGGEEEENDGEPGPVQRIRAVFQVGRGAMGEGGRDAATQNSGSTAPAPAAIPPPTHRSLASWRTLHPSLAPDALRLAVCGVLVSLLKAMHKYTRVPEALQREVRGAGPMEHLAAVVERDEGCEEDEDEEAEESHGSSPGKGPVCGVRPLARYSAETAVANSRTTPRVLALSEAQSEGNDAGTDTATPAAPEAPATVAPADGGVGDESLSGVPEDAPARTSSAEPPSSSWLYGEHSDGEGMDGLAHTAVSEEGSGSSEDEGEGARVEQRPLSPVAVEDVVDKEKFLAEQVSADAERFMRHFLDTQLFSCFVQSRTEQQDCDFFDQWSFLKMQLKAARLHVLRSGTHAGLLYKAQRGTRHGWTRRWFVLEDLSVMYFAPNEALLKAEREAQRQREARSNSGDFGAREIAVGPNSLALTPRSLAPDAAAYNRAMMAVNKERKAAQRGHFDITEGHTRIQIPARRKLWPQFRTSHVLEVTKTNDAGEVVDTLCLCADTAEEHSAWLTLLRSRLHDSASMTELANLYLRGRPATLLSGRIRDYNGLARTNSISFGSRR